MSKNSAGLNDSLLSHSFIALVFSLTGCALLETWLFTMHASLPGHALALMAGLSLVFLSLRHSPVHTDFRSRRHRPFLGIDAGYAFLLFAIGSLIGLFILSNATLALAVLVLLSFIPWSRLPLCRHHFFTAATLTWAGIMLVLFIGRHEIRPMFLPLASWVSWTCACFALLLRTERLWQIERNAKRATSAPGSRLIPD